MEDEEIFQTFRPYCSALASKPNLKILQKLKELVQSYNACEMCKIQEYIIFPMQLYLKKPEMPENYTLAVMNFIAFFFDKIQILNSNFVLKDLLNSLLVMSMSQKKLEEDFKLHFLKLFSTLFNTAQDKSFIFGEELKLPLSHLIFQTLQWAEEDESKQVVLQSLSLLQTLVSLKHQDKNFAPMLPGITTRLVKILRRNFPGKSHKIKAKCLDLWADLVTESLDENFEFVGKAQDHLFTHLQIFLSLSVDSELVVRKSLLNLVNSIQEKSWDILRNTRPLQIEILALLCVDYESGFIRDQSWQTMDAILARLMQEEGQSHPKWLIDLTHCKIFDTCKVISDPEFAENLLHEEKALERHLATLHGFLLLFKAIEQSSLFLYSETYVIKLLEALIWLVQLEKKSLVSSSVVFLNLNDCDFLFFDKESTSKPEKTFRHLSNSERVTQIAQVISGFCLNSFIISHLTQNFKRESIFILNLMIEQGDFSYEELSELATFYLEFQDFHEDQEGIEWSQKMLIMEGLAFITKAVAEKSEENLRAYDRDYLSHTLVYCISHVDVTQSHEAHVLFYVLNHCAKACGYSDIGKLLEAHNGFISRQLCLLLRRHLGLSSTKTRPKGLSSLLRVVLKQKQDDKALRDVITILLRHLDLSWMDSSQPNLTKDILNVISIFVSHLNVEAEIPEEKPKINKEGKMTKLIRALKYSRELEEKALADEDLEQVKCPSEGFHDQEKADQEELSEEDDEKKPDIPEYVKFLKETIQHCRHFISFVGCPQWQLLAMQIVGEAILKIKMQQDELLPLVHQSWQPLKLLFTSSNLFVVEKAFNVLKIMAKCAKEFIRKRTLTDVFPALINYLKKLQVMVSDRGLQQTMAARQSRRMLRDMTRGLWDFMALLDLTESEVDPIIDHMLNFVTFFKENRRLVFRPGEEKAESEFENYFTPLRQMDSDILWLKTNYINLSAQDKHLEIKT